MYYYFINLSPWGQGIKKKDLSINDKVLLARGEFNKILDLYINDKERFNREILANIKEPFQFLSIFIALSKVKYSLNKEINDNNQDNLYISNPILFDASCNGLQHLSALTREINVAEETNLIYSGDLPKDFYGFAANVVQKYIDISENDNINKLNINRDFIKKTVMTIPYNITSYGISEHIKEKCTEYRDGKKLYYLVDSKYVKNNQALSLHNKDIISLSNLIYTSLLDNIPSLKLLNKYLDGWVDVMKELNLPIVWITPSGLKINLSIMKFNKVRTRSKLLDYSKPVTISLPTNKLDIAKIKSSLMPNLVHSLDASNIHILTEYLNDEPLYTIHDCFASTPNNMNKMNNMVKNAFIKIYFEDSNYIEKMHNNFIEQIKSYVAKDNLIYDNEDIYIILNDKNNYERKLKIPNIPSGFTNKEIVDIFVKGIRKSKYFIS